MRTPKLPRLLRLTTSRFRRVPDFMRQLLIRVAAFPWTQKEEAAVSLCNGRRELRGKNAELPGSGMMPLLSTLLLRECGPSLNLEPLWWLDSIPSLALR